MLTDAEQKYISVGESLHEVQLSKMFGKPCLKIDGKAFASYHDRCMVFKLRGDDHTEALSLDGSQLFDPTGKNRPMREWVQVPFDYADRWAAFARAAQAYVRELTGN